MSNHSPVGAPHHLVSIRTYVITFVCLILLMAATIFASFLNLGSFGNNFVAMFIACVKAVTVVLIFMGVKYSTKLTKLWAAVGFVWLTLIFGILIDYATRTHEITGGFYQDSGSAMHAGDNSRPAPADGEFVPTPGDDAHLVTPGKAKD